MSDNESRESESNEPFLANPVQRFLVAVVLSGVPIFAYLSLSVDMTEGSWAAVGGSQLGLAAAVPLLCGLLSVWFGQRIIRFLTNLLESVHLPF